MRFSGANKTGIKNVALLVCLMLVVTGLGYQSYTTTQSLQEYITKDAQQSSMTNEELAISYNRTILASTSISNNSDSVAISANVTVAVGSTFVYTSPFGDPRKLFFRPEPMVLPDPSQWVLTPPGRGCSSPSQEAARQCLPVCDEDARDQLRFALVGDSHAEILMKGFMGTSTDAGRWMFMGGSFFAGAPKQPPNMIMDPDEPYYSAPALLAANEAVFKTLQLLPNVTVVAIACSTRVWYNHGYNPNEASFTTASVDPYEGLNAAVDRLVAIGKRVILMVDNPSLPKFPEFCALRGQSATALKALFGASDSTADCFISISRHIQISKRYWDMLLRVRSEHPNHVEVFDTIPYVCDTANNLCGLYKEGASEALFSYTDHVSYHAGFLYGADVNARLKGL